MRRLIGFLTALTIGFVPLSALAAQDTCLKSAEMTNFQSVDRTHVRAQDKSGGIYLITFSHYCYYGKDPTTVLLTHSDHFSQCLSAGDLFNTSNSGGCSVKSVTFEGVGKNPVPQIAPAG